MLDEVRSRWTSVFHVKHGPLISEDLRCEDLGRRWRSIPSRSGHLEGGASRIGVSAQPSAFSRQTVDSSCSPLSLTCASMGLLSHLEIWRFCSASRVSELPGECSAESGCFSCALGESEFRRMSAVRVHSVRRSTSSGVVSTTRFGVSSSAGVPMSGDVHRSHPPMLLHSGYGSQFRVGVIDSGYASQLRTWFSP